MVTETADDEIVLNYTKGNKTEVSKGDSKPAVPFQGPTEPVAN